jgi:putative hydrolase of the HAD superfamily
VTVLMVDVDGVIVRPPDGRRWDHDLAADLGLAPEVLQREFFAAHFADIVTGKADLHERLAPVLAEIAPHLTSQALADYWFAKDAELDLALLDDLAARRAAGTPMHLATVQEHHRARYLWDTLRLRERFDGLHYAADYGVGKPDPAFFQAVAARLDRPPGDLLLIDDSARNVEAARACGWRAELWTAESRLAEILDTAHPRRR